MHRFESHNPRNQQGVVLIVALILLMTLTVIGVTTMTSTSLEEKMAANTRDREVAFQAAEAALREAERRIRQGNFDFKTDFDTSCTGGTCGSNSAGAPCTNTDPNKYYWADTTLKVWDDTSKYIELTQNLSKITGQPNYPLSQQPRYIIEFMGCVATGSAAGGGGGGSVAGPSDPKVYRITALGFGQTDRAKVMLQSTYKDD